jgi:small subunit ribosomal protein S3
LRTERARFEKFRAGYLPKCGEPSLRYMRKAVAHVQLKPGMFGVRVRIMPPDAKFPDKIQIVEAPPPAEEEAAPAEEAETEEQAVQEETKVTEEAPAKEKSEEASRETNKADKEAT